jgi:hypothetical protein
MLLVDMLQRYVEQRFYYCLSAYVEASGPLVELPQRARYSPL